MRSDKTQRRNHRYQATFSEEYNAKPAFRIDRGKASTEPNSTLEDQRQSRKNRLPARATYKVKMTYVDNGGIEADIIFVGWIRFSSASRITIATPIKLPSLEFFRGAGQARSAGVLTGTLIVAARQRR